MNSKVLTTTTNAIEGTTIEKYIDLVSTNVVLGTNVFSDIGASITDLFGGISDTYQSKLQKIYKVGLDKIKVKASNLGANAILGISIDFNEVSGKGKSMFMISIVGTAVKLKFIENRDLFYSESNIMVDKDTLESEVTKRILVTHLRANKLPSTDDWMYLLNSPIDDITSNLLDILLVIAAKNPSELSENENLLLSNISTYIKFVDLDVAVKELYDRLPSNPQIILNLIIENNLFSASKIRELIHEGNINLGISCLKATKNYYVIEDLELMEEISVQLNNLKPIGKIEIVKGFLGKEKEKFICQNGHINDLEVEYCETFNCGRNINGLTKQEVSDVASFRIKIESLRSLIDKK